MRLILLLSLFIFSHNVLSSEKISLSDVSKKVRSENYYVLENAERVYQAKERINFSKKNLLPRLNFWNVIKLPFDWASAIDIVQDIAPFLVPANWFSASQDQYFYLAQSEQYRALVANEVMTAKLLYTNTLRDLEFLNLLETQKSQIAELVRIAEARGVFGETPQENLKFLKIRELEVQEDVRSLSTLVFNEKKALSFMMGIPQEKNIELESIALPKLSSLQMMNYEEFIFRAIDHAPEVKQFSHLKEALKYTRKAVNFSFLGSSSFSGSAGGGVFSNIPIQDGLGFGRTSSLRISRSEGRILDINKNASEEVIKQNLYHLISNFNSYVENSQGQELREKLAKENYELVRSKLILGEPLGILEVLTSIQNVFDASISLVNYRYEAVNTIEKLKRLLLNEDYNDLKEPRHETTTLN